MGLRPKPHSRMQLLRLLATCFVINMALSSAWIVIQFDGAFEQGPPSPSELHVSFVIDSENTTGDVSLQRATNFIVWTRERDDINSTAYQENNGVGDEQSAGEKAEQRNEDHTPHEYLDITRDAVVWQTAIIVICEFFLLAGLPKMALPRNITLASLLMTIIIAVPMSYIADLEAEGGGYSFQGNQPEQNQFVHYFQSADTSFAPLGFEVEMETGGYDLGWVDPEHRQNVSQTPPEIGEEGYDSLIVFKGSLLVAFGQVLQWILVLPLIWYMLPTMQPNSDTPIGEKTLDSTAKEHAEDKSHSEFCTD
jgi:hypothetical protein